MTHRAYLLLARALARLGDYITARGQWLHEQWHLCETCGGRVYVDPPCHGRRPNASG
jgi:hypothetical protein